MGVHKPAEEPPAIDRDRDIVLPVVASSRAPAELKADFTVLNSTGDATLRRQVAAHKQANFEKQNAHLLGRRDEAARAEARIAQLPAWQQSLIEARRAKN